MLSFLDELLGQVSGGATVENLAEKVGLTPEQTQSAVAALGEAHGADGDTIETAAANTGLPAGKLQEIVGHIGGEGCLGQFASLLQESGGASGLTGKLSGLFG